MAGELVMINSTVGAVEAVGNLPNFDALIERFLLSTDVSAQSLRTYKAGIAKFLKWVKAEGITSLSRADIVRYKNWLSTGGYEDDRGGRAKRPGEGLRPGAVATYMAAVKAFYTFAGVEVGAANLAKGVKSPKQEQGHKKSYLTNSQAETVLNSIDRETAEGRRDFALMYLLTTTGLRTIEVTRANVGDIGAEGNATVLYVQGKGRADKSEYVKLPPQVESAIRNHLKDRHIVGDGAPLFASLSDNNNNGRMNPQSLSHIVKARLRAAGFDNAKLTAHSLRHTAVTLSLLAGATIQEAQAMARHRSINTTLIYAHNIDKANNPASQLVADMLKVA